MNPDEYTEDVSILVELGAKACCENCVSNYTTEWFDEWLEAVKKEAVEEYKKKFKFNNPAAGNRVNIITTTGPNTNFTHPCVLNRHRWAWLAEGGQGCGVCGVRR